MDCQEITQAQVALEILKRPGSREFNELFHCIYKLFKGDFINWILRRYSNISFKEKVWEDAKDAFQMGMEKIFEKSMKNEFTIKASLKTTVYSYGLLQLLAKIKQEQSEEKRKRDYLKWVDLLIENDFIIKEVGDLIDDREKALIEALNKCPEKQRRILTMKFFGKLRSKEIAGELGFSTGNVDNEKTKAYKTLREYLKTKFIA